MLKDSTMVTQRDTGKSPVIIIGAGPTGLGAAYKFHQAGFSDWVLYERENDVGGLAKSYCDDRGFTWDIGGHVVFSHYGVFTQLLDQLFKPSNWLYHERESWIWVGRKWVPYPFQNNIHRLDPEMCLLCLEGLIETTLAAKNSPAKNFDEFIVQMFGKGIADIFMRPYNNKVWAYPPKELNTSWVSDRVSIPDLMRIVRNVVLKTDDVNWGPNNKFLFPRTGGTGSIWKAIAGQLPASKIITGCEVAEIDTEAKIVRLSNGTEQTYEKLISTMPLDRLVSVSKRDDWIILAKDLAYSSVHIVGIGLNGKAPDSMASKCWIYFPENYFPFYRVTHFSKYSPNNVDNIGAQWSLMVEISESSKKPIDMDTLVNNTLQALIEARIIKDLKSVIHTWQHRVEYGYPTPSLGRDRVLNRLLPLLQEAGIYSRGRFGAWKYEVGNMDHSFMQGYEAANHILHGGAELTVWCPEVVNQRHRALGWNLIC